MFKQLFLFGFFLAFGFVSPAYSACDQEWAEIYSNSSLSNDSKIQRWEGLKPNCSGKASYDHRLAFVYSQSGKFDDAERILRESIKKYSDPNDLAVLEYDLIDLERERLFYAGSASSESLKNVLEKIHKHIEKYRNHSLGYSAAAGLYLLLAENESAAEYSQKAISIEPDYLAFRTLAIASTNLDNYDQAIASAISASELNPGFRRDIDLMMSAAYAYISIGDVRNAKAALGALLQERPEIKEQEGFNRLVGFVYKRAEELEDSSD